MQFPVKTWIFRGIDSLRIDPQYTINMQGDSFSPGLGVITIYIFAFCMAVIASVVIIKQLKQYGKSCRTYQLKAFCEAVPPELNELLQRAKEDSGVKKPVRLICSRLCDTPMTIGVFSPAIVVPVPNMTNLRPDDLLYILKHELLHIKNWDMLIKFLALFALAIHWYNPICYLLYRELCVVSELDCDYGVLKDLDDTGRQQYGDLIIDLAVTGHSKRNRFAVELVNNEVAITERRIFEMKQTGKTHRPVLACIVMAMICIMGTMTAFAYEAPIRYEAENDWSKSDAVFFSDHLDEPEHFMYDYFFVDLEGNITPLEDAVPQASCVHIFNEGYTQIHTKNSNGGCVVEVYEAQRCTQCGYIKQGELISETKYTKCPH